MDEPSDGEAVFELDLSPVGMAIAYPGRYAMPEPAEPPRFVSPFTTRQSALMDIIRSAKTDWPTARQQLIDFEYAPPWKATIPFGEPGWWDEVEDADRDLPDTWNELEMATWSGMLSHEQYDEVHAARWARDFPNWQPGDFFRHGQPGYRDAETGEFVERDQTPGATT